MIPPRALLEALVWLEALHWAPADAPALAKCLFHETYGAMENI